MRKAIVTIGVTMMLLLAGCSATSINGSSNTTSISESPSTTSTSELPAICDFEGIYVNVTNADMNDNDVDTVTVIGTNPNPYPVTLGVEIFSPNFSSAPPGGALVVPANGTATDNVTRELGNSTTNISASYDTCQPGDQVNSS